MANDDDDDELLIVGGGFAGQCFARDILRRRPGTRLAIVDRGPLPGDPRRRGVGESTSEIAAWYLRERLGLGPHLEGEQIVKFGLRFWLRDPAASDAIAERVEFGPMRPPFGRELPLPLEPHAYQLHRGRLEARLAADNLEAGATLLGQHTVLARHREGDGWRLTLRDREGATQTRAAPWLVDASGGSLGEDGLGQPLRGCAHRIVAAWWWIDARLDPGGWDRTPALDARDPAGLRWRSTHHLVGPGYWVWLIPLADGSTSVGVVVDPEQHRLDDARDLRALLAAHEPELLARLDARGDEETFGSGPLRRWDAPGRLCLEPVGAGLIHTGAALGFIDPLYSAGHDLTTLVHELAIPHVIAALDRRAPLPEAARREINHSFARVAGHYESLYQGAYGLLADPRVAAVKFAWDQLIYFAWPCVLVLSGQLGDPGFAARARAAADRVHRINDRMQGLLRAWAQGARAQDRASARPRAARAIDHGQLATVMGRFLALPSIQGAPGPAVLAELQRGVVALEDFALATLEAACLDLGLSLPDEPLDPYAIGLDPRRWAADRLFASRRGRRIDPAARRDLARLEGSSRGSSRGAP